MRALARSTRTETFTGLPAATHEAVDATSLDPGNRSPVLGHDTTFSRGIEAKAAGATARATQATETGDQRGYARLGYLASLARRQARRHGRRRHGRRVRAMSADPGRMRVPSVD